MTLLIDIASFSLPKTPGENQDAVAVFRVSDMAAVLAVADGMGGEAGGAIAAATAIGVIKDWGERIIDAPMLSVFETVRDRLIDVSKSDSSLASMGTTLTLCLIADQSVRFAHVGDCRVYHLRARGIQTRTKDQTEVQALLDYGVLSRAKARRYPRRNVLVSVLSPTEEFDLQEGAFSLEGGDRVLIVSDGVYKVLSKAEIRDISVESESIDVFLDRLRDELVSRGLRDDSSVVVVEAR